jgi:BirA family biotin operon repressor/biotin-[acetyl-CoA-carboxylase] ligase
MHKELPDLARARELVAERGLALGQPLTILAETTSTNDEAKRAAKAGAPGGATWVAESQTAGRGRQGRAWVSPRGENLLVSVLVRVACTPSRLPPLALVAGLAARDAVARAAPACDPKLKWPNDVVIGPERRKVAGVLVEALSHGGRVDALIVGVGINVHTRDFPEDLAGRATSIALHAASPPDRAVVLADLLAGLDRDLQLVASRGLGLVHARLSAADALRGSRVRTDSDGTSGALPRRGPHQNEGVAEGIDLDGRLLVRRDDGILARWTAGEVHLV